MKVGMLFSRSGVAGMYAPSLDAAALLGAAEINQAGGILGEELEIVFGDCGFSSGEATAAADQLIEIDRVSAIIGTHTSDLRDPVSRQVRDRAPYIYTSQYEGIPLGPSTAAIGATDLEVLGPALNWLRTERKAERYFFVGNDYIWPRITLGTARDELRRQSSELVGTAMISTRTHDFSALLATIARSNAQVVVTALVGQCSVDFNRAFAAAGLDQKILRFGLIVDETVICGIGPEASANLFTASSYFASQQSHRNDSFRERYYDAFGAYAPPVSASSMGSYEGLHVFAGLVRELGTADSRILARELNRPKPRHLPRHMLADQPTGIKPTIYLGEADGATLRVVCELSH